VQVSYTLLDKEDTGFVCVWRSHLHWQQAVALCMLWVFVAVECVIVWGRVMMKKCVVMLVMVLGLIMMAMMILLLIMFLPLLPLILMFLLLLLLLLLPPPLLMLPLMLPQLHIG
jgi:hypothetical protein